jgi:hypothetical protein
MGFNLPGEEGKVVPHPYIEIVRDGTPQIYEYGPQSYIGSPMIDMHKQYDDSSRNAAALFKIAPPPGVTMSEFVDRAMEAGQALDTILSEDKIPYIPAISVDCDTATSAMFQTLGGSLPQFAAMTLETQSVGLVENAFTAMGGASIALTPQSTALTALLSAQLWSEMQKNSPGPAFGMGSVGVEQLQRDAHGQWREGQQKLGPVPEAMPGAAPEFRRVSLANDVQTAVDMLRDSGGPSLPAVRSLEPWDSKSHFGSFVDVGENIVAQHVGKGAYMSYDVAQDLGGVPPPLGRPVEISKDGQALSVPEISLFRA